jgi:hypothetical protein
MDILTNELVGIREQLKKQGLMAPIDFGFNPSKVPEYYATGLVMNVASLEDGATYLGFSRANITGIWDASHNTFMVVKPVDGEDPLIVPINHFENYDGTDVFIPVKKVIS